MKRLAILLLCGMGVCIFVGCPEQVVEGPAIEVIVDGGDNIPDKLAGVWKADRGGWEFIIEPDGKISSAVVSLGRVRLEPGQKTVIPMKMGGNGTFEAGRWTVHYSYESRELTVEVTIANFRIELGKSVLKGSRMDLFTGTVSSDGRSWWANRYSFPEYTAETRKYRNFDFEVDPDETPPEELLFEKVSGTGPDASSDSN